MGILSDIVGNKKELWEANLFVNLCPLEIEYAFKKSGGKRHNTIDSKYIEVKREPNNKYDPRAVAIYAYNVKIGYFYQEDRDEYLLLKNLENPYIVISENDYSENKYRAKFRVTYRSKKKVK